MKKSIRKFFVVLLTFCMMFAMPMSVYAVGGNSGFDEGELNMDFPDDAEVPDEIGTGTASDENTPSGSLSSAIHKAVDEEPYPLTGGGTMDGSNIVNKDGTVNDNFADLTAKGKQDLLQDMNKAADEKVKDDKGQKGSSVVTNETKNDWLVRLQRCDGVGSQLLTTVLANTKPDFVTANRIYQPFSGLVGTILGLGAVLLFAAVAIVMVCDISYMAIPFIRNIGSGDSGSNQKPNWVSYEAYSAIQQAEGGEGGNSSSGAGKQALGIYFKKRVIMLILLGVCLLYLIQGQIFTFVGWVLDLVSGFVGF